jgi:hemerythrin-like domain-containing protein
MSPPTPWVEEPYSLISTLSFSKDVRTPPTPLVPACPQSNPPQTSHSANYVATQMALAHNGMIRGLNSIFLQAPNIPASDTTTVRDFLTYCQCWCESMHHHHDAEEAEFFPSIETISGVKGLMEQNVEQHRAFTPGFDVFYEYAKTCKPGGFDGKKVKELVEGFAEPLTRHLHDEIETLRALKVYDSVKVRDAYKRFEKLLMATDNVRHTILPAEHASLTNL